MTKAKNYAVIAAAALMMICIMAGTSFAQGPQPSDLRGKVAGSHHMKGGDFDQYLVDKGIPAATVNAYRADKDKFRDENRAAFEAMRAKGLELYEEMSKAAPNVEKAKALQAEISKLRADFDVKHLEHQLYLKSTYPQVCEIMQKDFADRGFGPNHPAFGPGFGHNIGKPGPAGNNFDNNK